MALWRKGVCWMQERDDDKKQRELIERNNWVNPVNSFYHTTNSCLTKRTQHKFAPSKRMLKSVSESFLGR